MKRLLVLPLLLTACLPTVGDACTTDDDCGPGVCVNESLAPGGLCSRLCGGIREACPSGTECVADVVDGNRYGCLLNCQSAADCREGYECRTTRGSANTVCVGPN